MCSVCRPTGAYILLLLREPEAATQRHTLHLPSFSFFSQDLAKLILCKSQVCFYWWRWRGTGGGMCPERYSQKTSLVVVIVKISCLLELPNHIPREQGI
jgi:hypothetical protein